MKHYSAWFVFGLLLLAACQKEDPTPAPTLLGRWDWVQSKTTSHHSDGSVRHYITHPSTSGPEYMIVTADSMTTYRHAFARPPVYHAGYGRYGNMLNVKPVGGAPYVLKILELTDHRLVVRDDASSSSNRLFYTDREYSR